MSDEFETTLRTAMRSYADEAPSHDGILDRARERRGNRRLVAAATCAAAAAVVIGTVGLSAMLGTPDDSAPLTTTSSNTATSTAESFMPLPESGWPDDIDVALQARYEGFLRLSPGGCLYGQNVAKPVRATTFLWPKGWQLHIRPDGAAEVVDADGRARLEPGDYFEVSGGGDPLTDANLGGCPPGTGRFSMHSEPREATPPTR